MKKYCYSCEKEQPMICTDEPITHTVKDVEITVNSVVCTCSVCGEEIFDVEADNECIKQIYRKYREKANLLQPEEIKAIRDSYRLSQAYFAKVLGFGEKTLTRYENGSLQDRAHNNLILLARNFKNFQQLRNAYEQSLISVTSSDRLMYRFNSWGKELYVVDTQSKTDSAESCFCAQAAV